MAKHHSLLPPLEDEPFLKGYTVRQDMPIYAIDLTAPINFAKLTTFRLAATGARILWEDSIDRALPSDDAGGAPMVLLS